jgi:hypothetical protein
LVSRQENFTNPPGGFWVKLEIDYIDFGPVIYLSLDLGDEFHDPAQLTHSRQCGTDISGNLGLFLEPLRFGGKAA